MKIHETICLHTVIHELNKGLHPWATLGQFIYSDELIRFNLICRNQPVANLCLKKHKSFWSFKIITEDIPDNRWSKNFSLSKIGYEGYKSKEFCVPLKIKL